MNGACEGVQTSHIQALVESQTVSRPGGTQKNPLNLFFIRIWVTSQFDITQASLSDSCIFAPETHSFGQNPEFMTTAVGLPSKRPDPNTDADTNPGY